MCDHTAKFLCSATLTPVRAAEPRDLPDIEALQRRNTHAVGHLPTDDLVAHILARNAWVIDGGGGYCIGAKALRWQSVLGSVIQIAIHPDQRRSGSASALLATMEAAAVKRGLVGLQANCAADLQATHFWRAKGYVAICYMRPGGVKDRDIVCWRKWLGEPRKIPLWFAMPPKRAGWRNRPPECRRSPRRAFAALGSQS